jgi:hypothetical protein
VKLLSKMPDLMDIVLWGFVATVIMTIILSGSQRAGLSRLSLPFLIGTCFTANRNWAHVLGFGFYLVGGWVFAFLYALLFAAVGTHWWTGAIIGLVHGLFLLTVVMSTMPHIHPRMASEYDGPTEIRRLQPPGFFGLNYGYRTPLSTLIAQVLYGVVLGAFLP